MDDEPATRRRLLGAAVLGTLAALAGIAAAIVAAGLAAAAFDDGSFLSGLVEGLIAGVVVLGVAAIATVVVVRYWVGRGGAAVLGWGWATLAVLAGVAAACVLWMLGAAISDAMDDTIGDLAFVLFGAASLVAAPAGAYGVLRVWAAR